MNLISKPSKENLKSYLPIGLTLIFLSFLDVITNAFFDYNLLGFLPSQISYFSPLIFGFIGFYLIRIEFSGIRSLDILNKNINSTNFNAFLTLLTLFILIKSIPPLLNWFILDANFLGILKKIVQVTALAGCLSRFGSIDLCMVFIQMQNNGELIWHF